MSIPTSTALLNLRFLFFGYFACACSPICCRILADSAPTPNDLAAAGVTGPPVRVEIGNSRPIALRRPVDTCNAARDFKFRAKKLIIVMESAE